MDNNFTYATSLRDFPEFGIEENQNVLHLGWTGMQDGIVIVKDGKVLDIPYREEDWMLDW